MNHTLETKFKAYKINTLSTDDLKVLSLLYLPIIELNAYSLYLCLFNLINLETGYSNIYDLNFLSKILNLNADQINLARQKLDIVGLLETYKYLDNYSNEELVLFKLNTPLSSKSFVENDTFSNYLESFIGEKSFLKLIERFQKLNIVNNKTNITETNSTLLFKDNLEKKNRYLNLLNEDKKVNKEIHYNFDKDKFINLLEKSNINVKFNFLDDNNYINDLKSLAFAYSLKEEDLVKYFINSFNLNKKYPSVEKLETEIILSNNKLDFKDSKTRLGIYFENADVDTFLKTLSVKLELKSNSVINESAIRLFIRQYEQNYKIGILYASIYLSYKYSLLKNKYEGPNLLYMEKVLIGLVDKYKVKSTDEAFKVVSLLVDQLNSKQEILKNNNHNYYKNNKSNIVNNEEERDKFIKRIKKNKKSVDIFEVLGIDLEKLKKSK